MPIASASLRLALATLSCVLTLGCLSAKVVPMSGDTYLVSKRNPQLGFGPPEGAKREVFEVANEFCNSKGMEVEVINLELENSGFAKPASASLQFRCVPKGTAKTGVISDKKSSETQTEKIKEAPLQPPQRDIYTEIIKLDDLRKKGLITDAEFEAQKKKLLESQGM